jgi:hypothetical protein
VTPAVIIGVIGYFCRTRSGRGQLASVFYGITALALGVVVALVKVKLAAH